MGLIHASCRRPDHFVSPVTYVSRAKAEKTQRSEVNSLHSHASPRTLLSVKLMNPETCDSLQTLHCKEYIFYIPYRRVQLLPLQAVPHTHVAVQNTHDAADSSLQSTCAPGRGMGAAAEAGPPAEGLGGPWHPQKHGPMSASRAFQG